LTKGFAVLANGCMDTMEEVLAGVGTRLRRLRRQRNMTLVALAETTGISVSTLSRLESGKRRPSLELLLPLAQAHQVPLDELVGAPAVGDPRVRLRPQRRNDMIVLPLTRRPGGLQAVKLIIPERARELAPRTHEGYGWFYVLNGRLRFLLAGRDMVLEPGEAAEFDARLPHRFGGAGGAVEVLSLFGPQGERLHLRAKLRPK